MKHKNYTIRTAASLIILSALVYFLHWILFRDIHHIFIYLVGDIAFVFIEVLLVTVIIHQILNEREKRAILSKLNMVIGAFFSEVGNKLLDEFVEFDQNAVALRKKLLIDAHWKKDTFGQTRQFLTSHEAKIDSRLGDLEALQDFLVEKRPFLLRLLENPNLLEHETFTELLWAVFHLAEELSHRKEIVNLPESDLKHLAGDIKRVYTLLIREWLNHMEHLKKDYPYLFSLAIRLNPFNPEATAVVA